MPARIVYVKRIVRLTKNDIENNSTKYVIIYNKEFVEMKNCQTHPDDQCQVRKELSQLIE